MSADTQSETLPRTLLRIAVVTVAYSLGAWLGRLLLVQPENLASFWLPSGVSLAALLLSEKRRWPGLVLGIFVANIVVNGLTGSSLLVSAAFGLANCAEPVVAALLVDRVLGTPLRLVRLREMVGLILLVALLSNAATALLGAAVPWLAFGAPYWAVWRVWWIADALGILLLTPVIMSWASTDLVAVRSFSLRKGAEAVVLFVSMLVVAALVFRTEPNPSGFLLPFPYATFPFLLWAALRFGLRGTSPAALALAVVAVWGTAHHLGPFVATGGTTASQVLSMQSFLGVVTISALLLATVMEEVQRSVAEQARSNAELARSNAGLARSNAELARSNAELEQFAYVASHDLREPLRAVASMAQLLEQASRHQLDEEARGYLAHIVEGVVRGQGMIDDLLEFSRISSKPQLVQVFESEQVLRTVMGNLAVAIQESGAEVTHEGLPALRCDPTQLMQLLQSLIGNSIKFRGESRLKIHVKAELRGAEWVFMVRDNGIGIDPQYFDRIFTVFQRLHTRRAYPGRGIGLAICKKIVTLHGGRIWVESVPGQGAAFYFTYPQAATAA